MSSKEKIKKKILEYLLHFLFDNYCSKKYAQSKETLKQNKMKKKCIKPILGFNIRVYTEIKTNIHVS